MEKDLKLSESLLQMSNIHETLDHFCSIIKKSSKIIINFSKNLSSLVKNPIRLGTDLDNITILLENNIITISEIFAKISRFLQEESFSLQQSSKSLETSRKSIIDLYKFSGETFLEARKTYEKHEKGQNTKKKTEKTWCPSLYFNVFNHSSMNSPNELYDIKSDNIDKVKLAKQEVYHESERIFNEKMNNLMDIMKKSCFEAGNKVEKSFIRIKNLYEKGIISFYEEEKKYVIEENSSMENNISHILAKNNKNMINIQNVYQTPLKNLKNLMRFSPHFSNFDSEVKIQSTEQKQKSKKRLINPENQQETDLIVTFNEKNQENKENLAEISENHRQMSFIKAEDINEGNQIIKENFENLLNLKDLKKSLESEGDIDDDLNSRVFNHQDDFVKLKESTIYQSKEVLRLKKSDELSMKEKIRYSSDKS